MTEPGGQTELDEQTESDEHTGSDERRRTALRRICLTLPTNRACERTLVQLHEEATYAATEFGVDVVMLVLDSCPPDTFAVHTEVISNLPPATGVSVLHLSEEVQRTFLCAAIEAANLSKPELVLDLMLPQELSYGACTNRAFLIAAALGCESVHRRDSDLDFQIVDGRRVFPIHYEVAALGRPATEAAHVVTRTDLDPRHGHQPVSLVGASFIGELSVDIDEIRRIDPQVYADLVGLWAADGTSEVERRELVEESFAGAGQEPFIQDDALLAVVDPMRIDMMNIAFYQVHEDIPHPPAVDTIGSDYFLMHVVHDAGLPGVLHNRHVINYYTPERRTDDGFRAYHLRYTKFILSMLYLHDVYRRMAAARANLLDDDDRADPAVIADLVRQSIWLDVEVNRRKLASLEASYQALGGRYAECAEIIAGRRERLISEARQDMEDFVVLLEAWRPLVRAGKAVGAEQTWR
jgi:hypothetical protein